MPDIETDNLFQKAVLRLAFGPGQYGAYTHPLKPNLAVANLYEIPCRWLKVNINTQNAKGEMVVVKDLVVVDRTIPTGSLLWQGTLAEYESLLNSEDQMVTEVKEVVRYNETPDIDNKEVYRTVHLAETKNTLSDLAQQNSFVGDIGP